MITALLLSAAHAANPTLNAVALDTAAIKWGINTVDRVECWLGNVLNESGGLVCFDESLTYTSAEHIFEVFRSHFTSVADASAYVNNPQKLGDKVYASIGGYAYRGCGWPQITGKENFVAYSASCGVPVPKLRTWLDTPTGSADAAGWYFKTHGCAAFADAGDFLSVCDVWEGLRPHTAGPEGWSTRQTWYNQVKAAFGRPAVPKVPYVKPLPDPVLSLTTDDLNEKELDDLS